jgi:hypothetical protein
MPDNTTGSVTAEATGAVSTATAGGDTTAAHSASDTIRDLRKRAQDAEKKAADYEAKEEAARQEKLKAEGKFGEVETELKGKLTAAEERAAAAEEKAAKYEAQQEAARKAAIESLPEAHREIASALPADKLAAYVALQSGKAPAPKPGAPGTGTNLGKASPEEIRENSAKPGWLQANFHRL